MVFTIILCNNGRVRQHLSTHILPRKSDPEALVDRQTLFNVEEKDGRPAFLLMIDISALREV